MEARSRVECLSAVTVSHELPQQKATMVLMSCREIFPPKASEDAIIKFPKKLDPAVTERFNGSGKSMESGKGAMDSADAHSSTGIISDKLKLASKTASHRDGTID